jgi:anaerobic selenocysteine-containing dehydrogenase
MDATKFLTCNKGYPYAPLIRPLDCTHCMSAVPLHDPTQPVLSGASTDIRTTTCYMCACRCGIRVHLRDGEVRYIEGNPEHPLNQGIICAKGSSGIMKQYSPARLTKPLKRKAGTERGDGQFEEITWDEAFSTLEQRLRHLRATDPKQFALFTGRDQMQALTGLFARQFGTPNYAAHGGFCSVNMAAGMIYTIGGSFWEFGGPDLERAKLFVMIGTAEDHHSNPMKRELSKFKRNGGRFVSINPVRTGYSAIADEWVPIKPGTDGALMLALIHELIKQGLYDREFLTRYTNSGQLVNQDSASDDFGMFLRKADGDIVNPLRPANFQWWDRHTDSAVADHTEGADPALLGRFKMPDGTTAVPAFQLLQDRVKPTHPNGQRVLPAFQRPPFAGSRMRWVSRRAIRRSSCPLPGPTAGANATTPSPATLWHFTRCGVWPRTPTAFTASARWRS